MPELIDLEQALAAILDAVRPLPAEDTPLTEGLGRVLAEDVESPLDVPPFDSSAMDGYAVRADDGGELRVVGEARAGHPAEAIVEPGTAVRISTGAQIPDGTEAVVPVERAEEVSDGRVRLPAAKTGGNVRRAGEDVRAGRLVVAAGTSLGPAELGVLASLGRARARCARLPRVALLVTGDELVEPGEPLLPGQIYSSNSPALAAQVTRAGAVLASRSSLADDSEATREALGRALESADVICVSGGVSVGRHDHVKSALRSLGVEERFWGVRLKPGKPTWFGARDGVLAFGLPGNPVSAMVTFQLFVRPALRALQGADPRAPRATATLAQSVPRGKGRLEAVRCGLHEEQGALVATPTGDQGSHRLTSMLGAEGLALIPPGEGELAGGERVEVERIAFGG
jgi:molybdopterin molybdotransferase